MQKTLLNNDANVAGDAARPGRPAQCARWCFALVAVLTLTCANAKPPSGADRDHWTFTVSGASSDCGNLVMPAIAAAARADHARFHWHLGDMRRAVKPDIDFMFERRFQTPSTMPTPVDYAALALSDVVEHQLSPFAGIPLFVTLGGRDDIRPLSRLQYRAALRTWLDRPEIRSQRNADGETPRGAVGLPSTYYHWRHGNVDFVSLDSMGSNGFDVVQLKWIDGLLMRDLVDPAVRTVVVGSFATLPFSRAEDGSLCATKASVRSGERVYEALARLTKAGKHVYVLSANAHRYLENVYDTDARRLPEHGGVVLPGFVAGTAGAERQKASEPSDSPDDQDANGYGYLRADVTPDGEIRFSFRPLTLPELEAVEPADFEHGLVAYCTDKNVAPAASAAPSACTASEAR